MPVQRIPRYELLIKELIKQTTNKSNNEEIVKKLKVKYHDSVVLSREH